jgi:hypothetical protein
MTPESTRRASIARAVVGLWVLALFSSGCSQAPQPTLKVENARVRDLIPGQDKTVGYFDLINGSAEPARLVAVDADQIRAIEIHSSTTEDGIMRMRRLSVVEVPAGASVHFRPGGNHLMLFGVTSLGADNVIRLHFEDGRVLPVRFRRIAIDEQ